MPAFCVPRWVGNRIAGEQAFHFFHWNHCDWLPKYFNLCLCPGIYSPRWNTPAPFPSPPPQMRSCLLVIDISVPVPATSKYSFINEVPCLAVKAQSSKTSIPIVTRAGTPSPCRGLWNGCQENTIMCWHENNT